MISEITIGVTIAGTVIACKYVFERLMVPFLFNLECGDDKIRKKNKRRIWIRNKLFSPKMIEKYSCESGLVDSYVGLKHENGMTWKEIL